MSFVTEERRCFGLQMALGREGQGVASIASPVIPLHVSFVACSNSERKCCALWIANIHLASSSKHS